MTADDHRQMWKNCANDQEKELTAKLFDGQLARGTSSAYNKVIRDFKEFCDAEPDLSYNSFGSREVHRFVLAKSVKGVTYLANIKPAITRLEVLRGRVSPSAVTPFIEQLLSGAKRIRNQEKPEVVKMEALDPVTIRKGVEIHIIPLVDTPQLIDLQVFRTLYRWVFCAHTLTRFEGYSYLKAKHFKRLPCGSAIAVKVPREKNDPKCKGQDKMLSNQPGNKVNPMMLTELYFQVCGYTIGQGEQYINCRIMKVNGRSVPHHKFSLSRSEAAKQGKKLAASLGHTGRYGETSAKRMGVTEALRSGVSIDTLQQVGQWKNNAMPLYYLQNSDAHKVKVYKQMNLG